MQNGRTRRTFLATAVASVAGAACTRRASIEEPAQPSASASASAAPDGRDRVLLRGGVVLSLDAAVGDFEQADVLIGGRRIAAVGPSLPAGDALVVDCSGAIVMPGFVTTHHHQYETLQRSIIADGILAGAWPQESYGSVVQNIWTAGRIADPGNPNRFIWDLGRVPYDPEDCYISQLVACLSEISEGVTCGTDTSQANHTPGHTDAMIKGLIDSGRRMVFAYSNGTDRSAEGIPFELPGAINDATKGIGRIAKTFFSSRDQLVTLANQRGGPDNITVVVARFDGDGLRYSGSGAPEDVGHQVYPLIDTETSTEPVPIYKGSPPPVPHSENRTRTRTLVLAAVAILADLAWYITRSK